MARRRTARKVMPVTPVRTTIESMTHDGRGVAHVDGKAVFIDEGLPGEELEFVYTDIRKDYAEGRVVNLLSRSEFRVDAECPHYSMCGGCSFQHVDSAKQIQIKQELLEEQFKRIGKLDIPQVWEALDGPHWGYRRKARMGVKYVAKKGRVLVGFREKRQPYLAEIESCKVMHPRVGMNLMVLSEMIGGLTIKDKIPQIEVAIGDDDCVLSIRVMEPPTQEDKERMRQFAHQLGMSICLQPKGPDTIVPIDGEPEVMPTYALPDHDIVFKFRPAMFTQVNYEINRHMVNRVIEALHLSQDDQVLDLFCGLGNFTLPMARRAGHVTGIEGDLPLIKHARENALFNGITNAEFHAADLTKDISEFPWANRRYNKILLDPSRAGASDVLHHFKQWQPETIVYVSCNPSTLARDAGILVNELGYKLIKAGVMNMFPQTAHVESIALFEKR
ncbi:MAG: 23S rRNA (uracil(1939)-C(5))-methyltransferase RlmD [Methylicorpusculum sp.]|uniref:23S rRNA (uracil(1939)-C(5))-methyltransferase RlmD n=1 Tax=Methylicorpusculum sp. TaxID=2713644 RepID=UPI00271EBEE6|nr:23S rRNA (uracil(1939)-C(5))-methyltransferase RlmD [Methylicorpusculum sp.]MDO8939705.1 23S rRNA (uracil(1939)-C(5))-methyltransferase RlmD [Methylicorpusculum sp.]MDP2204611.1 23S rRNA (uracil(1939)-C(5))-methyltransferase RlmD [Methylicorpusculum sp.]